MWIRAALIVALADLARASPTTIAAELDYVRADADGSDELSGHAVRIDATHTWWRTLSTSIVMSAVRVAATNETENDSDVSLSNPSVLVRYAIPLAPFVEIGVTSGVTSGVILGIDADRDLARDTWADAEAARRPYELGGATAVPFIVDARLRTRALVARATAGAYVDDDDHGRTLGDLHLALAVGLVNEYIRLDGAVHALYVPALATVPHYYRHRAALLMELGVRCSRSDHSSRSDESSQLDAGLAGFSIRSKLSVKYRPLLPCRSNARTV